MGNDCFWLVKDVSMLEEELVFLLEKGIQEEGFSNLWKRGIMFCRDRIFSSSLQSKGFDIDEEIKNTMNGTPQDESNGYKCNISFDSNNDGTMTRGSSNSMNEGWNEERNGEKE